VGTRAEDATDAMFDKDFDVAVHMYFQNKEAQDRVKDSRQHKQFAAECRENWKKVRMFDSLVQK
jgi:Stress responsive A/B Barrel Domain